jgi:membrane-bound metal-dependent hydrolase YbcI (DUF457 family)
MALIVGHALLGAGVATAWGDATVGDQDRKRLMAAGAVLGVLPDLDLILTWILGLGIRWHADFTHSILFAVGGGYVGVRILGDVGQMPFAKRWLALSAAMMSHGILDWATKKSYGGASLLWPLERERYRLGAFDYFVFYPDSKLDPFWKLALRAVEISFYELLIFGLLFALILAMRRSWNRMVTAGARR